MNNKIPLVRKMVPGSIASQIVGVQPMGQIAGKVYSFKVKYTSSYVSVLERYLPRIAWVLDEIRNEIGK